ncbi:MAG: N-acetylmuramoyl-L-alanine amidase [Gaiellaceae bacterium]
MKLLSAAAVVFLALPAVAHAAGASLAVRELPHVGAGIEQTRRFDLVGLHWQGSGAVLFRTRGLDGRWSRWQPAASEPDDVPDHGTAEARRSRGWHLGNPYWASPSNALQYRIVGPVRRVRAYFVRDGRAQPPAFTPTQANTPAIVPRSAWGAVESIRRSQPRFAAAVRMAIIHHTAGSNSYTAAQSAAIVRAIEVYHVRGNGWDDIGYNFLVDRYGQIFEGRYGGIDRPVIGAHALGFNNGSVGIAYIGNGSSPITAAARAALVALLAWRLDVAHIDPLSKVVMTSSGNYRYPAGTSVTLRAISGHRDTGPTECPGNSLYGQLPSITRAVAATGVPKIYSPLVRGQLGGSVRFTARMSNPVQWTVAVTDALGRPVASGTGLGTNLDLTWDSSAVRSGSYLWTISAPGARPATGTLGTAARLTLTDVHVNPKVVTPNGDRRGDNLRIEYTLGAAATLTATLFDSNGNALGAIFTGFGSAGRHSFVWSNIVVPDGRYRLLLDARSPAGVDLSTYADVVVDRTLSAVGSSAVAFSPNGDGRLDSVAISFQLLAPADLLVQVLSQNQVVRTLLAGHVDIGPHVIPWDGSGLRDGSYVVRVGATDPVTTVSQDLPVTIDTKPPTLRLVSRRSLTFWISEVALVTANLNGQRLAKTVRPGLFRLKHTGSVRHFSVAAVDRAGNTTRLSR